MYLGNFIKNIGKKYSKLEFSGIAFDSRKVKKNYIFFAINGNKLNGYDYIADAINNGAKIIISEKSIKLNKKNITSIISKNPRKLLSELTYKFLIKKPKKLVAVTGTNGKSSVSDFYYQILSLNKKKSASIGTIGVQFENKKKGISNTTLDPIKLKEIINYLLKKNINNIILEASSHGLKQNRLDGLSFDIGVFTNLSHDHMDYHKNIRDYQNSKLYLFKQLIKKNGIIITDDAIPQHRLLKKLAEKKKIKLLTVLSQNSDLELLSHKYENEQQFLSLRIKNKKIIVKFKINLIGKIQIKNILMAMLAAERSGIDLVTMVKLMPKLKPVEGRFENIGNLKDNSKVILDYAHTPDALKTVLTNIKEQFPYSKIRLVFGCGGERDKAKRSKMGLIASKFADFIYLTNDNPRRENPKTIRNQIVKGIKQKKKLIEIASRKIAISRCINDLHSGEIAIVAGKGHEKTQEYKDMKFYFSDREEILNCINIKNKKLFNDLRLNIIQEKTKLLPKKLKIKKISINSKDLEKNDIFFAIKGKKNDGSKFINEAYRKKSSMMITHKLDKVIPLSRQVRVNDTLNFLTECATDYRKNLNTNIIGITGSCGKTTLKELLGKGLDKITKTYFSPKSFNNKFGVPLSLLNLKQNINFGVFEVGMDRKGEIDYLSKILKPNLGIITNISYAHSKNFENIKGIANAKSELIDNITNNGSVILNKDDQFYNFLKNKSKKKNLSIYAFSLNKNNKCYASFDKILKINNGYKIFFKIGSLKKFFYSNNNSKNHIQNLLAALTAISLFFNLKKISNRIFLDFQLPEGRGDLSKLKIDKKIINLIDESYNSNPLSLKTSLINFANLDSKNSLKHVLLGDMLELGRNSSSHHKSITKLINKLNIHKVHVYGKDIKDTYVGVVKNKKGSILENLTDFENFIKKTLNSGDYLMIKGSNSTGLHKKTQLLKLDNHYGL
jgi:murE/murF fusion protein